MIKTMRASLAFVAVVAAVLLVPACSSQKPQAAESVPNTPFVRYSVSGQAVIVISAKTPFDDDPKAREAFLGWFKRGFETGLARRIPLRIEWQPTTVGEAGRRGYELGLEQGTQFWEKKLPRNSQQTALIPRG